MNEKFLIESVIKEEFEKIEKSGRKIRLRSTSKMITKRWIWTIVITVILGFVFFPAAIVFFIVRAVKYRTFSNVEVIYNIAKDNPDKAFADIIAEELM
ncbi:MAG: hypothetical protein IJ389_05340 [Clostridia bacterium]|nr:hypothetical protein [Clostridia bacterium]